MAKPVYSMDEVKHRLNGRIDGLVSQLLPAGRRNGHEWVALNPLRHDSKLGSLSVNLETGLWSDFATLDLRGDAFGLVVHFACGGDAKAAWRWALDWLGLTGKAPDPVQTKQIEHAAKKSKKDLAEQRERLRKAAWRIACEARQLDGADPASLYLKARDIDVARLAGGIPRALRFHPQCWVHRDFALPALVAFMSLEGEPHGFCGVHRIWLAQHGGVWGKAFKGEDAKKSLGTARAASVRLTKGASNKRLADAPAGEWPVITEGIEDALSLALSKPEKRIIATTSVSRLATLWLPEGLGGIYLAAQNDAPGSKAEAAFAQAATALRLRLPVKVVRPPAGVKDWNDLLQQTRENAA